MEFRKFEKGGLCTIFKNDQLGLVRWAIDACIICGSWFLHPFNLSDKASFDDNYLEFLNRTWGNDYRSLGSRFYTVNHKKKQIASWKMLIPYSCCDSLACYMELDQLLTAEGDWTKSLLLDDGKKENKGKFHRLVAVVEIVAPLIIKSKINEMIGEVASIDMRMATQMNKLHENCKYI